MIPPAASGPRRLAAAATACACLLAGQAAASDQAPGLVVEPGYGVVPANHLKFYLQFPSPMERGEVFRHLRLAEIDAEGREIAEVPEPFREVELWDETFTRMTLWFHPGRQKPGVNLNVEIGPILEEGKSYRLEISGLWRDEAGAPLGEDHRHEFRAGPPDETQPHPAAWSVEGGRFPLLRTDDLLDPVSARAAIVARDASGAAVPGVTVVLLPLPTDQPPGLASGILLDRGGPWPPGSYLVEIQPRLEDLAGNSLARPFNLDLIRHPDFQERTEPYFLPLVIPEEEVSP